MTTRKANAKATRSESRSSAYGEGWWEQDRARGGYFSVPASLAGATLSASGKWTLLGLEPAVTRAPKHRRETAWNYTFSQGVHRHGLPSLQYRDRERLAILPALRCEYNDGRRCFSPCTIQRPLRDCCRCGCLHHDYSGDHLSS